jgi:hypothetical protein
MAPGLTLLDATEQAEEWGYLLVVDETGAVVWYYRPAKGDAELNAAGNILNLQRTNRQIIEVDMTGAMVHRLLADENWPDDEPVPENTVIVPVGGFHHDVWETAEGTLLTLHQERRAMTTDDCPSFDQDWTVVGDLVVEISPEDGALLNQWSLFDVLDPCRRGTFETRGVDSIGDWTHANSVVLDVERNALIVSLRHADWVIAIRYADDDDGESGDLLWRLGAEGDLELEGEGALWPYHQHAAEVTSTGNLLLFDNGNLRPGTDLADPTIQPWSRGVEYAIDTSSEDPEDWTATQVWEFGTDEIWFRDESGNEPIDVRYFAGAFGDADLTESETVLMVYGRMTYDVPPWARIIEVTHDEETDIVFELHVRDPEHNTGFQVYRAERIETLYTTPVLRGETPP